MVNGNYLTINNAPFLSTSKVSSKNPPRGGGKIQKKNTTQRGEKKTTKKKTQKTPPPPWNLCMESLHIFFFIHLDLPVFFAHLVASWQLCG